MPGLGFIRVKLLQCDSPAETSEGFDPYVAINVKESVNTPGNFIIYKACCVDVYNATLSMI